jgi:hypothetical protein
MQKVFIHTNNKQLFGAKLAKFAIERKLPPNSLIKVRFINVDELDIFRKFAGKKYVRAGFIHLKHDPEDLQSFTLSRFMPPELMNYEGRSVLIDPDIFAIQDITPLFEMNLNDYPIAACGKKDAWDSSLMIMDNSKLRHWKIESILDGLTSQTLDYDDVVTLRKEPQVMEIPRIWNNLDKLTPETKMVHMTNRITQPWKTGLPIDFTRNPMPKFFGIIPRETIHKLLGKYQTHYQRHPDIKIEEFLFELVRDALKANTIKEEEIQIEIDKGNVRKDFLEIITA